MDVFLRYYDLLWPHLFEPKANIATLTLTIVTLTLTIETTRTHSATHQPLLWILPGAGIWERHSDYAWIGLAGADFWHPKSGKNDEKRVLGGENLSTSLELIQAYRYRIAIGVWKEVVMGGHGLYDLQHHQVPLLGFMEIGWESRRSAKSRP